MLALSLAGSARAPASPSILPPGAIAPTDAQRSTARKIGRILEEAHYSRAPIDKKMSEQVFQRYLDFLDPQHSYFLASDIAEFQAYRLKFDDMIRTGEIDPAYLIFARFQQRNRDRIQHAIDLLKSEPDWTVNESFDFDRTKAAWVQSEADLNELWRKRVKNDALSLLLTGKSWSDAADLLRKRYERVLKRVDQVSPEDVFENLMNAYAHSFDPHSSYFSPRNSEEYRIQMSLNYEGIGASLQLVDDYVTIMNVIEGGPAAVAATLNQNDRITAVGQGKEGELKDVIGWRLDDVVQLIRGKAGTTVRLQVLPAGAAPGSKEKTLEFVRNKVTLEAQAAHKEVKNIQRGGRALKIGVITVPGFYQDIAAQNAGDQNFRSTTRDVLKLLN
ncbi:MAG: PDZ domain-containing protein, partial [Sinobacteraceae bacterium]|nr:PDZ domain-containing protein [Nevskiaceae bacterium]